MMLHILGWSLLHFLWQGAAFVLVLRVILLFSAKLSAQARYIVCCATLGAMAMSPVATFLYLDHSRNGVHAELSISGLQAISHGAEQMQSFSGPLLSRIAMMADLQMPWFLGIWFTGALLLLMRTMYGTIVVRRLKTTSTSTIPALLSERAKQVAARLELFQNFDLRASGKVNTPSVIGWLRPVILFPISALANLTPDQLESLLVHELAHIRRHDYLVNTLQAIVESALFYHPAVWWVSAQIRRERESCCDDRVVQVTGAPLAYANALYLLEERRSVLPQLILCGNGGQLTMRIKRLLGKEQWPAGSYGATSLVLAALLLLIGVPFGISAMATRNATAQELSPHDAKVIESPRPDQAPKDAGKISQSHPRVKKDSVDLSCTFYDQRGAGHPGMCELHRTYGRSYFCRQTDEDKQAQLQIGCEEKINALQQREDSQH